MAAPVLVSSQTPPGDTTGRFYALQAQKPLRIPRLVGLGDTRLVVTTDQAATGVVANLTTLFATQVAATGLVLFPFNSVTIVTARAAGRRTAGSIAQYIERRAMVVMGSTATPEAVTNSTATSDITCNFGGDTLVVCSFTLSGNDVIFNLGGGNAAGSANYLVDINIGDPFGIAAGT